MIFYKMKTSDSIEAKQQDTSFQSLLFLKVLVFIALLHRGEIQVIEQDKI